MEQKAAIKTTFHKNKKPINVNDIDIEEIVLLHKKSYGKDSFRYFIKYSIKVMLFHDHCV